MSHGGEILVKYVGLAPWDRYLGYF